MRCAKVAILPFFVNVAQSLEDAGTKTDLVDLTKKDASCIIAYVVT